MMVSIDLNNYLTLQDGFSGDFRQIYLKFALDYKNIFRVLAVNCEKWPDICKSEGVEAPTIKLYPP
jgi:hypothetical protein